MNHKDIADGFREFNEEGKYVFPAQEDAVISYFQSVYTPLIEEARREGYDAGVFGLNKLLLERDVCVSQSVINEALINKGLEVGDYFPTHNYTDEAIDKAIAEGKLEVELLAI